MCLTMGSLALAISGGVSIGAEESLLAAPLIGRESGPVSDLAALARIGSPPSLGRGLPILRSMSFLS